MAATFNESQKIDYLWKKVGYGVTKTAEVTSKEAFNESIASPLLYRGDLVWMESDQITGTPPSATNSIIQVYKDGSGSFSPSVECTEDLTSPDNQTWKTNLTNWVPTQFGDNYLIQVYVANSGVTNPQTSGTKLFQAGSGSDDTWFFDYQSGVLNFNGANIPSQITGGITGKSVYIVGYRYVGLLGVTNLPSDTTIGNLNFTGTTISSTTTNGNIILTPNGTGIIEVSSALTSNANITASYFLGNGSQLTGVAASNAESAGTVTASAQPNITSVGTLVSLDVSGNVSANNANLGNAVTANYFIGSGNNLSNIQGANVVGNVTSAITANFANYAGNVTVAAQPNITSVGTLTSLEVSGNGSFGNISTTGSGGNITGANVVSAITFSGNLQATSSNVTSNSITNNLTVNLALSGNTANFTGNIISLNANLGNAVSANFFLGDGGFLTNVAAGNAATAGSVTDNAQPNITSVGTLVSLDVSGNLSANNANLGNAVTANYFIGSGNNLSNIQGSNVVGNVTSAVTANFANYAGNVTVAAQSNITSVGTLTSLAISGNLTSVDYVFANYVSGDGNQLSNINGSNVSEVANANYATYANYATFSGNAYSVDGANVSGQVGNALVAGTVYTNAQPNITSVGTLTSLDVSGNANTGNLGTNNFIATGTGSFSGNVNMNNQWINNVGYPNVSTDAASKAYVDTMVSSGISYHEAVAVATTTTLAIATGGTTAYNSPNGAANGIGAYISTTGTYLNIDGANVQTIGTRILVKNEANAAWNGVYVYANTTAIVRATDADQYGSDSAESFGINDFFFTTGGSVNEGVGFIVSGPTGTITFGTSDITFSIFTTSQVYDAGTGLTLTGTEFSISNTTVTSGSYGNGDTVATFTVNSQGQLTAASNTVITANAANLTGTTLASNIVDSSLTSVGTLTSLSVTGNVTAGNMYANSGTIGASLLAGALTTAAQPNITSLGTLSTLTVSGNVAGGNLTTGGAVVATGNGTFGNISTTGSGGNITGANVVSANTFVASNANLGNAVTANYFIGNLYGTANLATYATTANAVAGANVSGQVANALIAGTVYTNAQPNITSVGTLTSLDVSGTSNLGPVGNVIITGGSSGYYLQTDGSGVLTWAAVPTGTGISNGTSNVNIPTVNGNITMSVGGNANIATVTGTGMNVAGTLNVTGNANVANLGTGGLIIATGNITGGNIITAGNVNAPIIKNGSTGMYMDAGYPGYINFFNGTANPTVTIGDDGNINAIANITGANLNTGGVLSVTGNANVGNLGTSGLIIATGNVTGGNINSSGTVTASRLISNVATGTAPLTVTSTTQVANLNVATAGTAGTVTTNAQPNITSTGTLTGLDISGHLIANTFQMGYDSYAFYASSVYFATTASIADNQVLWSYPAAQLSAIDFTIIATDDFDSTRQTCKISAAILGTTVVYNEYGGLYINGGVGSFSVVYNPSTSTLDLVVTPDSSNLTEYSMLISKYLV